MTFTLETVMDALNDAFERAGAPSRRDCRVSEALRDILSARTGRGKATESREKERSSQP